MDIRHRPLFIQRPIARSAVDMIALCIGFVLFYGSNVFCLFGHKWGAARSISDGHNCRHCQRCSEIEWLA